MPVAMPIAAIPSSRKQKKSSAHRKLEIPGSRIGPCTTGADSTNSAVARCSDASTSTSTSSATFRAPKSAEYGFIPQSVCLTTAFPLS